MEILFHLSRVGFVSSIFSIILNMMSFVTPHIVFSMHLFKPLLFLFSWFLMFGKKKHFCAEGKFLVFYVHDLCIILYLSLWSSILSRPLSLLNSQQYFYLHSLKFHTNSISIHVTHKTFSQVLVAHLLDFLFD